MRLQTILLEYNRDKTWAAFGPKMAQHAQKAGENGSLKGLSGDALKTAILTIIEEADPSVTKEYSQWIARMYANGSIKRLEDVQTTISTALKKFHEAKIKKLINVEFRDINRCKTADQFLDLVDKIEFNHVTPGVPVPKGTATEFYRDSTVRIIMPKDEEAACYYGRGTRWCTAADTNNQFNYYNDRGSIFILIPTKAKYVGEKYQLHFESKQVMNEKDQPVRWNDLLLRFPSCFHVFEKIGKEHDILAFHFPKATTNQINDALISSINEIVDTYKDQFIKCVFNAVKGEIEETYRSEMYMMVHSKINQQEFSIACATAKQRLAKNIEQIIQSLNKQIYISLPIELKKQQFDENDLFNSIYELLNDRLDKGFDLLEEVFDPIRTYFENPQEEITKYDPRLAEYDPSDSLMDAHMGFFYSVTSSYAQLLVNGKYDYFSYVEKLGKRIKVVGETIPTKLIDVMKSKLKVIV